MTKDDEPKNNKLVFEGFSVPKDPVRITIKLSEIEWLNNTDMRIGNFIYRGCEFTNYEYEFDPDGSSIILVEKIEYKIKG